MNKLSLKNFMKKKKRKGFTLVELIIVIAIIAILVAIAIPKFGQITKDANAKADLASAKTIHSVASTVLAEGGVSLPSDATEKSMDDKVAPKLDGGNSSSTTLPATKSDTNKKFHVTCDKDGNIKVYSSTLTTASDVTTASDSNLIYPISQ